MIGRILLAVDRSGHAREAVRATSALASGLAAEVVVVHVHETPLAASLGEPGSLERVGVETADQARDLVEGSVAALRRRGVDASGGVRPARATTAAEILAVAEELDADLVALGARGLARWRGLLLGSVARAVVQLAPCPVLVARRRHGRGVVADPRRILIGVDGSAGAARATALTAELADRLGASVLVVHARDGSLDEHEPDAVAAEAAAAIGGGLVAAVRVRAAGQAGVTAVLCEEAVAYAAGLMVVGRRGRSALTRLLLGGVSERLLQVAPCPVLVVPDPPPAD